MLLAKWSWCCMTVDTLNECCNINCVNVADEIYTHFYFMSFSVYDFNIVFFMNDLNIFIQGIEKFPRYIRYKFFA